MKKDRKKEEQLKRVLAHIEEAPKDKEFIKMHVSQYPQILEYINKEIFEDRDFCIKIYC